MKTIEVLARSGLRVLGLGGLMLLAGCASEIGGPSYGYYEGEIGRDGPGVYGPGSTVTYRTGYDYFPEYEVYYDRYRGEYIYIDNGRWVRTPRPRGMDVNVLLSTPSVHLEFRDSPARYHREVVRTYPRGWHRDRYSRGYDPRLDPRYDPRYDSRYNRRW